MSSYPMCEKMGLKVFRVFNDAPSTFYVRASEVPKPVTITREQLEKAFENNGLNASCNQAKGLFKELGL